MKKSTMDKLKQAQDICDDEDRSTEYMIEFMKHYAGVNHDCVMNYIRKTWKTVKE